MIVSVAIVGTGVALYPVLKRQNEGVALGFVSARLFETGVIVVGILSLLAVVTLRQDAPAGADAASLVTTGGGLVAIQKWSFLIGQGLMSGITVLPIFLWEFSLGLYLVVNGFRPSAMAALATQSTATDPAAAAATMAAAPRAGAA